MKLLLSLLFTASVFGMDRLHEALADHGVQIRLIRGLLMEVDMDDNPRNIVRANEMIQIMGDAGWYTAMGIKGGTLAMMSAGIVGRNLADSLVGLGLTGVSGARTKEIFRSAGLSMLNFLHSEEPNRNAVFREEIDRNVKDIKIAIGIDVGLMMTKTAIDAGLLLTRKKADFCSIM
jgi:hypothetical protein